MMTAPLAVAISEETFQPTPLPGIHETPALKGNARGDINQQGKHIQELVERINALPDFGARELVQDCLQSVLELHGDGLARIMQLIKNSGAPGREVSEALLNDKMVRGLLLIHGLHPVSLENRLKQALEKVRPYMKSHGGNVELIALENDFAKLRLSGNCKDCPSSAVTMELAVRQAIEEACPDLVGFEIEGVVEQSTATNHLPANAPKWTHLEGMTPLADAELRPLTVADVPVLIAKVGKNLYAYRDECPICETKLSLGKLESNILHCPAGHRFDICRAGASADGEAKHLQPFPLLATDEVIKISVR
ncbi:MAG TPA: NifU family protein [Verrucomicrobiae bacterium]|jgi:Fe-S cluster biogenesis protein NfuA/nitrite reductase/ring-hydroxylating ferredoxin subunit|nr:NifU family protein [Verrucomicrobiae bacterium]